MSTIITKRFEYSQDELNQLISIDVTLGAAIIRLGRLERVVIPDLFTALVHAIVGQLISVKAADTIWGRMQDKFGEITAYRMAEQSADTIQSCGLSMKKAVCIRDIALAVTEGTVQLDKLHELTDEEVIRELTKFKGVGQWTAEMLLMNSMERRNILSWGDIAIRRGIMNLYGLDTLTRAQFEHYRTLYSPLGSIASIYLWEISAE